MVMHWNECCEENEIVEGEQACPLNLLRNISTKITLTFHYHSHHLKTDYQTQAAKNHYMKFSQLMISYPQKF